MRAPLSLALSLGLGALLFVPINTVHATPLTGAQVMQTYNLTVLGDLTSTSEVEGRTYVRGALGGTSSTYFTRVGGSSDLAELVVGGSITATGGVNVNNSGRALVAGNVNNLNLNGGTARVGGTISGPNNGGRITRDPTVVVPDYTQALTTYAQDLRQLRANNTAIIQSSRARFTATPDAQGQAVFTIADANSFFNSISEITFNLGSAQSVLINVGGTSATIAENFIGTLTGIDQRVFWNFYEATSLNFNAEFYGSVLAPNANVRNTITLNGSVAVRNLTQNGEVHTASIVVPRLQTTVTVAEPNTALILGGGLLFLLQLRSRHASRSRDKVL